MVFPKNAAPHPALIAPLDNLLQRGGIDERLAVVTALEAIATPEALSKP